MRHSYRDHSTYARRANPGFHVAAGASLPQYMSVHVIDGILRCSHSNASCIRYSPLSLEAILRVSSSEQLDLPSVHSLARYCLVAMFPSGPSPFVHPNHLEEALSLALRYNITSVSPPLTQPRKFDVYMHTHSATRNRSKRAFITAL